jgi:basic amino acid/polyamine antiporter, APA family
VTQVTATYLLGGLVRMAWVDFSFKPHAFRLRFLTGDVKTTWSFSAFNVLIYYAITNFAALQLSPSERLYPQWLAVVGLGSCLFLAFWVQRQIWLIGLALIIAGLIWRAIVQLLANN